MTTSSLIKPDLGRFSAREVFLNVYRDARSLRGVMHNEFLVCGSVEVFVPDMGRLVVGRVGEYGDKPGFYVACVGAAGTKSGRRYFLGRSRECGRVPLP